MKKGMTNNVTIKLPHETFMTNDETITKGISPLQPTPKSENHVRRKQNSTEHTLRHVDWNNAARFAGQISRQKLEGDIKFDAVSKYSNRGESYSSQVTKEITEIIAVMIEECCGVLQIDPSHILVATNHEEYMSEAGAHVREDHDSNAPLIEISTKTIHNVIKAFEGVDIKSSRKTADWLVHNGFLASNNVDAFIEEMREDNYLTYFVLLIAHEMYHVRQYLQDHPHFEKTRVSQEKRDKTEDRAYYGNQGEMAARGFALRYLREKIRLLENKSNRTAFENNLLDAIKLGFKFATEDVRKKAAYGMGKTDNF